tara:strand:+ start:80 stop:856 length:777 start_codon:yes stop_codon:yes gene_type:complete
MYSAVCFIYSKVLTVSEKLFLRRNLKSEFSLEKDGFLKISSKFKLNISKQKFDFILNDNQTSFYSNKYQKKLILSQENLYIVINSIFDRQFCNFLTSQTGFKYSVDFFCAYQNFFIPKEDKDKPWYANHYHLDKPNSENMLKIFIPMTKIGMKDGPLELVNISQTQKYLFNKNNIENVNKIYLVGGLGDIFLCKLNLCLHKAGIPHEGNTTNLIMLQLNPSRKWYINQKIYQRQYKIEPKFTSLTNKLVRRKLLKQDL